ncbi:hypothetical protein FRB98_006444 [Tulasnella sp. 332]|nr:hypothetical protein FRB98_006444 [Tulasnella sp. 332]
MQSPIQKHAGLVMRDEDDEDNEENQAGPSHLYTTQPLIAAPETNHWLDPGDRFILLGGDDENFLPFVVEAVQRAALVPFEVKATYPASSASTPPSDAKSGNGRYPQEGGSVRRHCIPYVESARVFVDPGRDWYRVIRPFETLAQARELGVKERSWWFLDARDEETRDYPGELAKKRAAEFANALVGTPGVTVAERWQLEWILWPGEASRQRIPGGWNSEVDIQHRGFTWREGSDHSTTSRRLDEKPWFTTGPGLLLPSFYDTFPSQFEDNFGGQYV